MLDLYLKYDIIIEFAVAVGLMLLGNFILNKTKSGKQSPPLLRFVFCTAFTYFFTIMREMLQFFLDYYFPSLHLQDYTYVPANDIIFFKIFGNGNFGPDQYPLYDTMFDFFMMIIGCAVAGAIILAVYAKKQKCESVKVKQNDNEAERISA